MAFNFTKSNPTAPATNVAEPKTKEPEAKIPTPEAPKVEGVKKLPPDIKRGSSELYEETFDESQVDHSKIGPRTRQVLGHRTYEELANSKNPKDKMFFEGLYSSASKGQKMLDLSKEKSFFEPGEKAIFIEEFMDHIKNNPDLASATRRVAEKTNYKLDGSDENLAGFLFEAGPKTLAKVQEKFYDRAYKRIMENMFKKGE